MTVFTVGYEGQSLAGFLQGLQLSGVSLLADLREAPISRKPGFSKTRLAAALQDAGIGYIHIRPLGCPRPIRDAYRMDRDWARYTRDYLDHLEQQQAALEQLAALCESQPTALLCYEADFNRCHRSFVAADIAQRTVAKVHHIVGAPPIR
jgi:uncharacterized protein (DUF488 family)